MVFGTSVSAAEAPDRRLENYGHDVRWQANIY